MNAMNDDTLTDASPFASSPFVSNHLAASAFASSPFALMVDPSPIQAAAQRIAGLGLPRLVVKAFSEKEKEKTPAKASQRQWSRRAAKAEAQAA